MKLPGNFQEIFQQVQKLQSDMTSLQAEVETKETEASAGGGMVTARVNGAGKLIALEIEPAVIDPNDREMLQDLVLAAVNEGLRKSREMVTEEMKKVTGGLQIPGL